MISAVLALIMFGIGATLKFSDFKALVRASKSLFLGLLLQMFFLPVLALIIAVLFPIPPIFKAGIFIVSICPGGTTSNFISYLVRADVALSIALTSINTFLIMVTIPVLSVFSLGFFGVETVNSDVQVVGTALRIFGIVVFPAILGVIFNQFRGHWSEALRTPFRVVNTLLLLLVFSVKIFAGSDKGGSGLSPAEVKELLPPSLLLHLTSMLISFFVAIRLGLSRDQAVTLGIEVGLQNTALALLVTATILGSSEMSKPALVFAMFSFFTTTLFAWGAKRQRFSTEAVS